MKRTMRLIVAAGLWFGIAACCAGGAAEETKKVLLLGQGPDGHARSTHEYMAGMRVLKQCLREVPHLDVTVAKADEPWLKGPGLIKEADGVVLFLSQGARWIHADPRRLEAFAQLAARGGGCVVLHWGMGTREARYIDGFVKIFGACHGGPDRKYKVIEKAAVQVADPDHPISAGIRDFTVREEFYYRLKTVKADGGIHPILQTDIDGRTETVAWSWERPDGGRSFGFTGGHFHDNWKRTEYRRLMTQAIAWTLKVAVPKDGFRVKVSEQDLALPPLPPEK